jgi:signal transduction histidine kinase
MAACPEGLAVVEDGRVLFANQAFARATGFPSAAEVHGALLTDVLANRARRLQTTATNFGACGRNLSLVAARELLDKKKDPDPQLFPNIETMGRLVGSVAHDFNNLLTGILLYCDLLIPALQHDPRLQGQVREMRAAGEQGSELVRQLLVVARHQRAEPRRLLWNAAILGMQRFLSRLAGEHIELDLDLAPDLLPIEIDPGQMQQILLNLVLNARDAMPDGGRITVVTRNSGVFQGAGASTVELSVSDTGCGMDEETRAHIFDRFFTTKDPSRGSGLGLASVQEIVAQRGGTIRVESAPGRGTRVTVRLPLPDFESVPNSEPQRKSS